MRALVFSCIYLLVASMVVVAVMMSSSIMAVPSAMLDSVPQGQVVPKNLSVDGSLAPGDCNYRCKCCYCWRYGRKTPKCLVCCAN